MMGLANILIEEGRYEEAEKLARTALEINRTLNIGDDSQYSAQILSQLGAILTFERKLPEAAAVYAELDKAIAKWEPQRREVLELNGSRINAHVRLRANPGRPGRGAVAVEARNRARRREAF